MALISGIVVDRDGRPLADARVAFSGGPVPMPDLAMLTDEHGQFTVAVPVTGTYELTFTADPHPPQSQVVDVRGGHTNVTVVIPSV